MFPISDVISKERCLQLPSVLVNVFPLREILSIRSPIKLPLYSIQFSLRIATARADSMRLLSVQDGSLCLPNAVRLKYRVGSQIFILT